MPADLKSRSRLVANIRERLLDMLGRECAICGETARLEINHIYRTKTYRSRDLDYYARNLRYLKEAEAGELNVLCSDCNATYRPIEKPEHELAEQPF